MTATATQKRKGIEAAEINAPCGFESVSFGDKTARLGIKIGRDYLSLPVADEMFCDRRLTGGVILGHSDDDPKQMLAFDDMEHSVEGTFDVKGFRVSSKSIALGLTFNLAELDRGELARFAKSSGRLVITASEDIPEDDDETPVEGGDDEAENDDEE